MENHNKKNQQCKISLQIQWLSNCIKNSNNKNTVTINTLKKESDNLRFNDRLLQK